MRIIIICGDPACGEEYPAETGDRIWECPHCGRERENQYYPFLTAQLMNARIHSEEADWREHHDRLLETANRRVADIRDHIEILKKDLRRLRVSLPEEEQAKLPDLETIDLVEDFLGSWEPDAPAEDSGQWRDLHDQLLEGARCEIMALEDATRTMEDEIRSIKSSAGLA
jgi:hypothetical protein